jgi:Domain of unknown function (DUF2019)
MTNQKLKEMSVGELVERFVAIALDQDKAIFDEDNTKFNKLYDQMQSVKDELRARPGDQRNALRALLDYPNMQVRLKAAITMLALAPDISKEVLRQIADSNRLPQAADAGLILNGLRDGSFVPS